MSAPFFVPFNFQPYSTTIKTTSYTIPAGYYALVLPQCGNFSIDSVLTGHTLTTNTSTLASSSTDNNYSAFGSGLYTISFAAEATGSGSTWTISSIDGSGNATILSSGSGTASVSSLNYHAECLKVTRTTTGSGAYSSGSVQVWFMDAASELWVKTGTVLAGDRYIVQLFPEIS